jgi:alkylation response protein AidB-like acyl-CoA dehydrogenase
MNELNFAIHEVHGFADHYKKLTHATECDKETIDMVVEASAQLCEQELAPLKVDADRIGCKWVDEYTTITPPGFKKGYDLYTEAQWQGLSFPEKYGGQGLPMSMALLQAELMATANWTWMMFPGLSKGAINTIYSHCTDELKDKYLPPLISGEMTGTMCLTEPGCGSDLGQVITKADRNDDGSYSITGTKIFISCGDHDLTDNIIHCVLARLPDAPPAAASPAGTRGISLFLVPKKLDDGSLNNVKTSRIEDKMGCHGSPTCQLEFEGAKGWLIGTENKGMGHMFTFINTSRVGTAVQGVAAAENAFQNSLWYAKDRTSMRALSGTKDPEKLADSIIHHPSVRSMLLTQKAIAEGGRSMIYECAQMADLMVEEQESAKECEAAGDAAGAKKHADKAHELDARLGFLTPILKGFLTEEGKEAADLGIQVYGGHGYIKDNHAELNYRDVRIAPVWEGTTQIQGLDLLGRKIMREKLKPIHEHCATLRAQCFPLLLSKNESLRRHAWDLLGHCMEWHYLTLRLAARALKDREVVGVAAEPYLMYSGYITLASHWLKMEQVAYEKLESKTGSLEDDFYTTKIQTSEYVYQCLLPRTRSLVRSIQAPASAITTMDKDKFSFDHGL